MRRRTSPPGGGVGEGGGDREREREGKLHKLIGAVMDRQKIYVITVNFKINSQIHTQNRSLKASNSSCNISSRRVNINDRSDISSSSSSDNGSIAGGTSTSSIGNSNYRNIFTNSSSRCAN